MASTQITQSLQVFTDLTGQPLDAGYIYVGQANQNPETNPIAVYWDAELTQPAAQPLRTVSGYISRQGTPASIYAASSYSITVKTKNGELVYYKSNVVTVLPASSVTTDMLVDRSVTAAKLADPVNALINGALQKSGGTMTGALTLSGNATSALHAVPKQQLDVATRAGIGSLTVTVASNALTGTLAAETLDFRSTTLTSGAPLARTASASASLTVPSGATLGTTNGVQARIVWGWLDNAGTLEPFVCNTAGGINLDETTLINTTAISASSNSASVIYSQTARTGVAFRVRGFCDITEATAGIWATAPTLVQGVGGQALAALSSLGYGQTWQDVTGSRALGVTYYNTTGRPIQISFMCSTTSGGAINLTVNGQTGTVAYGSPGGSAPTAQPIIPAGASYSLSVGSGAHWLNVWRELR